MKTLRDLMRDRRVSVGVAVGLVLVVLALLSFISPYDLMVWRVVPRDQPPSWEHLLGTNSRGQDVFWLMTLAVRNSLQLAIMVGVVANVIAAAVGLTAGYYGRTIDRVLMFFSDGMLVMPMFLILILLATALREYMNLVSLALILGIMGWPFSARLIRSQVISLREREFTYTALLSRTPTHKLIFNEYLPFVIPLILAMLMSSMIWAIGMEITLAIIGLTSLLTPTLGVMIYWALYHHVMIFGYWWGLAAPIGVAVALLVALYLISVGVSQYLDPRTRAIRLGARA